MTTTAKVLFRSREISKCKVGSNHYCLAGSASSTPVRPVLALFVKIYEPYPKRTLPPADALKRKLTLKLSTIAIRCDNRWALSLVDNTGGALNDVHLLPPLIEGEFIRLGLDVNRVIYFKAEVAKEVPEPGSKEISCTEDAGYSRVQVRKNCQLIPKLIDLRI